MCFDVEHSIHGPKFPANDGGNMENATRLGAKRGRHFELVVQRKDAKHH
jgi:hypothetical protein